MCGITGVLESRAAGSDLEPSLVVRMRDAMSHRGPDGAGLWMDPRGRAGFGHRRLSIVDLSTAADQPFVSPDGRHVLVFNGEIYNHAALRIELQSAGESGWTTDHSDTEVLLRALLRWGRAALHRLRGMFAFVLYDTVEGTLFGARDRVGIKPLYWRSHGGRFAFASEIKALLADPSCPRAVDEDALFHFLSFGVTPAPMTLFEGIRKLPAGHSIEVDRGGSVRVARWWDVWDHVTPLRDASDGELAERILSVLRESVRLRKVSDVPVGVFLSGGLDSSTNAWLFSEGENRPIDTFSIGWDMPYDSVADELPWARLVAEAVGAKQHVRKLGLADLRSVLPRLIHLQDEPIGDPVCIPILHLAQMARDAGVIVAHLGEGSDELFWGYRSWRARLPVEHALTALPRGLRRWPFRAAGAGLSRFSGRTREAGEWLNRASASDTPFWGGWDVFSHRDKLAVLSPRLRERYATRSSWEVIEPLREHWAAHSWDRSPLSWMTWMELQMRLPELLLMRVDKMTMGSSIEARVPFLDHELVTLALSIPERAKVRGGESKHLLKRAVRGIVDERVIDRPKRGFHAPVHEWMEGALGPAVDAALDRFAARSGLLDRLAVPELRTKVRGEPRWVLFNLALWWQHWFDGGLPD